MKTRKLTSKGLQKFIKAFPNTPMTVTEDGLRIGKFLLEVRLVEEEPVGLTPQISPQKSQTPQGPKGPEGPGTSDKDEILNKIMDDLKAVFPTREELQQYLKDREEQRSAEGDELAASYQEVATKLAAR